MISAVTEGSGSQLIMLVGPTRDAKSSRLFVFLAMHFVCLVHLRKKWTAPSLPFSITPPFIYLLTQP
ncbi:Uncharacterized protein TCM_006826 [Theobroma cacao]|uniref:Uncharacterized protein n=1 Tax=Theobroma cacao TaxID=3641 RepID=A0A061E0Q3_THECC|nr:Uncharacterized protein TCM_006826 [Theobroma cacao]